MTALDLSGDPTRTAAARAWPRLEADAEGCRACHRADTRSHVVFGQGDRDADLVIVGDAPSRHDDVLGRPLVGGAGNVLDHALADAGLTRDAVYVTTLVKCRGLGGPDAAAVTACAPILAGQLGNLRPRVVVTLGAAVASVLLRRPVPLARVAGQRFDLGGGATLVPTHHPFDVMRGRPQLDLELRRHLGVARAVLDGRLPTGAATVAALRARSGRESA